MLLKCLSRIELAVPSKLATPSVPRIPASQRAPSSTQPTGKRNAIIREAEANDYILRRIEFIGNERTSDLVLRKRMGLLQEGERFNRSHLVKSLANVSRLKMIYPVRISDVVLQLEERDKLVDILICFREKNVAKR